MVWSGKRTRVAMSSGIGARQAKYAMRNQKKAGDALMSDVPQEAACASLELVRPP